MTDQVDSDTGQVDVQSDHLDILTVQEAAAHFGVTEKTIRRRIKAGSLPAQKVSTSQGYEWRVHLDGLSDHLDTQSTGYLDTPTGQVDRHPGQTPAAEVLKALEVVGRLQDDHRNEVEQLRDDHRAEVDRLQKANEALTQAAEHWQARFLEEHDRVLRLLPAPKEEPASAEPEQPKRRWWQRLVGR